MLTKSVATPGSAVARIVLACVALLGALAIPIDAVGQPAARIARVGVLAPSTREAWGANVDVFRVRLRELGWIEGKNLVLDVRYADDHYDRLPALAAELVALKPDAIFAGASAATEAAKQATKTIPIVFETLGDAVSLGLVANLARPEGNATGLSGFSQEQAAKRLELIQKLIPEMRRVAILTNRRNPATEPTVHTIEAAARQLHVDLDMADVSDPGQLEGAMKAIAERRNSGFLLVADPMLFGQSQRIVDLAARLRIPGAYEERYFADRGGLLSYGPLHDERFQQMAVYVDRILRGAKPAELPVERPTKFELVVNLKTARALGLTVPQSLLLQANDVIH
jgi:putative ABC transport system substrate-binding protein